jgi:hypothetical protein
LDLEVQNGPAAGKMTQVNLYVPDATNRNAMFHYRKKSAGLIGQDLVNAIAALGDSPSLDALLETMATVFTGKFVTATIGLRADGQYAGQNELVDTKPSSTPAPAPTSAPAPTAAAPAPTPAEPASTPTPEQTPATAVADSPADSEGLPF